MTKALWAAGALATLIAVLLILDLRILISETKVQPGQHFVAEGHGDLWRNEQASLVCRYFTGRSVKVRVLWYDPGNVLGRDQCPFVYRER